MTIGQRDQRDQRGHGSAAFIDRPFVRLVHVIAGVYLVGAAIELLAYQGRFPSSQLWTALAPVAVMAALLVILDHDRTFIRALLYVVVGAVAIYATGIILFTLGSSTRTRMPLRSPC